MSRSNTNEDKWKVSDEIPKKEDIYKAIKSMAIDQAISDLMGKYAKHPSNANKYYHQMLSLFEQQREEDKAFYNGVISEKEEELRKYKTFVHSLTDFYAKTNDSLDRVNRELDEKYPELFKKEQS